MHPLLASTLPTRTVLLMLLLFTYVKIRQYQTRVVFHMFTMSLEKNDYKQWRNREHSAKGVWVAKLITSIGVEGRKLTCVPWEGVFWLNSGVLWAHKLKSTHLMDSFFFIQRMGWGWTHCNYLLSFKCPMAYVFCCYCWAIALTIVGRVLLSYRWDTIVFPQSLPIFEEEKLVDVQVEVVF